MSRLSILRRPAPPPEPVVSGPAPRVSDDVLAAVLSKDRRREQVPFEGVDRRRSS